MIRRDSLDSPESAWTRHARWQPRWRVDDGDSSLLWRLALATAIAIVALAAAGSLLA